MQRISRNKSFEGWQEVWEHEASSLHCPMRFAVYLPKAAERGPLPVLYWLSGLTCTEQNVITKAGFQQHAARHNLIVVAPDTSPRGEQVVDDPGWDMGKGAGFYVNATQDPWAAHYQMYDYIRAELPALIEANFPVTQARSIAGHSMGGHGALILALKNPGYYRSVSAFAPIVAPSQVPWGEKAFLMYLGSDRQAWKAWDAVELIASAPERLLLLIDQGAADPFLAEQLQPERLVTACEAAGHAIKLRVRPGYDHSFYFISTFLGEHFAHHAAALHRD